MGSSWKRSLAGIALILLVFTGGLRADENDKKAEEKKAAKKAAKKSDAASPKTGAVERPTSPAPARSPGAAGQEPQPSTPGPAHSNLPVNPAPAGRTGGIGTTPTDRPLNTAPGGSPRFGPNGNTPMRSPAYPGNAGTAGRIPPGGGRQFGNGRTVPGSVRAAEFHGEHAVYRGPGGQRTFERRLPDGRRIVADGRGRGLIERQYVYRGQTVVQRVYYVNGVAYPRYYNSFAYGGVTLAVYAPARYYPPTFYAYAYRPWARPVVFSFGFATTPWYGYYGGYFTPYPVYASPSQWLTDYTVANSLDQSYQAQAPGQQPPMQQTYAAPLTPDIKQQISEEVSRQIQLEGSERQAAQAGLPDPAASSVAQMLQDNTSHVFVVSTPLNLFSAAGQCAVTEGDVVQMGPPQTPNADFANVIVLSSKGQDCQRGSMVSIGVADLQEMQNNMRQTIDQGLAMLQQSQGQGGMPAMPAGATAPPAPAAYAQVAPPVDPNGAQQVAQEWSAGSQAEQTPVTNSSPGGQDPVAQPAAVPQQPAEPAQLSLGMSIADVEASQGKPSAILTPSPTKKIYVYPNFKVTFTSGKVTDLQ